MLSVATSVQQKHQTSSEFSNGGDGRAYQMVKHFGDAEELNFYKHNEARLGFTKTKDPVVVAWEHLDKQPISKLASMYFNERVRNPMKNLFSK